MKINKTNTIATRITDDEKIAFEIWCKKNGLSLSNGLRKLVLDRVKSEVSPLDFMSMTQEITMKSTKRKKIK